MDHGSATETPESQPCLRVLVLEDEALLSMLLEDVLEELGCASVGPFARVAAALDFLARQPDAVDIGILDINVAGERSDAVAEAMERLSLPFIFSTGYDDSALTERWRDRPILRKPFRQADLERILAAHRPK